MMRELILRLNSSTWRSSLQSSIIAWAVWHVVNYGVLGPDSQAIRGLYAVGQFSDKVVFLPVVGQRLALMVQTVLKPVQFSVMNVDMPASGQRLALLVQTVPKPVLGIMASMDQKAWFPGFLRCSSRCVPFSVFRPKMPVFMAGMDHRTVWSSHRCSSWIIFYMPIVVLRVVSWSRQCSIGGSAVAVHHGRRHSLLIRRGRSPWSWLFR